MEGNYKVFSHICEFVCDLAELYGNQQHSLMLYKHLLDKTKITHKDAIRKHIGSFRDFLKKNKDAIMEKKPELLKLNDIVYSQKVKIQMDEIFKIADDDSKKAIWSHLLVLYNDYDPNNETVSLLKKTLKPTQKEENFISDIFSKIEKNVDPNADPLTSIMTLMNSGVINEVVNTISTGFQDGTIDINRLMNNVKDTMSSSGIDINNVAANLNSTLSNSGIDLQNVVGSVSDMLKQPLQSSSNSSTSTSSSTSSTSSSSSTSPSSSS
jgi:hypothetical protein